MRPSILSPLLAASIGALAAALLLAAGPVAAAPPTPAPEVSDCVLDPRWSVFPELLLQGETATVTLGLGVSCPESVSTLHLALVLDNSDSLTQEASRWMADAARQLVDGLLPVEGEIHRIGVVSFNHSARVWCSLTDDSNRLGSCLNRLRPRGGSAIERGMEAGLKVLRDGHAFRTRRSDPVEIMVLISSGHNDRGCGEALRMARRVKDAGVLVITVSVDETSDVGCLRQLAASPRYYFDGIETILRLLGPARPAELYDSMLPMLLRHLDLVDTLAPGVALVDGSTSPPATLSDDGRSLRWSFARAGSRGITVTYRVRALQPGRLAVSSRTRAAFVDLLNYPGGLDLPPAWLTVLAPAHRP